MAARGSGIGTALGDLAGALLPLSARELQRELEERLRKAPTRLNEFGFDPYGMSPAWWRRVLLPGRAALPLLLPRRDLRHRAAFPAGRVLRGRQPRGAAALRRRDARRGAAARGRSAAHRARHGRVLDPESALGEHRGGAHRRAGRDAQQLRPHARERRVRDGVPGRRSRHEQALLAALPAPALRHGLHAPRARDGHADRAGRDRRLGGAAAGLRQPGPHRQAARHARLPDHGDLPLARPARSAAAAGQVPDPLRRAASSSRATPRTRTP